MKNLNKKIGAVALASMVVLGGVAASGAKSFAASQVSIGNKVSSSDMDALNDLIKEASYEGRSYRYKAFDCVANKSDARKALKKYDKSNSQFIPSASKNLGKSLRRFFDSGARYFSLEYKGRCYIVGLGHLVEKELS